MLVGGYGGYDSSDPRFDGIRSLSDVWVSSDATNWKVLTTSTPFGGLAWFGFKVWNVNPTQVPDDEKMWIVGGGYTGNSGNRKVSKMIASVDSYYSTNGIDWTRTNYKLGGGTSMLEQYSSNEWTSAIIDANQMYVGLWGLTLETFSSAVEETEALYIIGGDQDGSGPLKDTVYKSQNGLFCDVNGIVCGGAGECDSKLGEGCKCDAGLTGEYCKELDGSVISPAARLATSKHSLNVMTACVIMSAFLFNY